MLFVAALGVTAYLYWMGQALALGEAASARAFETAAYSVSRTLLDVRSAQQAYVAAGQGGEFWTKRVSDGLASVRSGISSLREAALSPEAQSELDAAASMIRDFTQLDRKVTNFARGGQHLMAADLIFADGHDLTAAALASVDQARAAEAAARDAAADTFRRRQLFALAAAACAALLSVLLLAPVPEPEPTLASLARSAPSPPPARVPTATASPVPTEGEGWAPPKRVALDAPRIVTPALPVAPTMRPDDPPAREPVESPLMAVPPTAAAGQPEAPSTDFTDLARLCTDLACVVDTRALPELLERAAALLDASGIILWIADPDGRELNPIFAQGYAPQLVTRLGTIPRGAENATAAAFRTSLVQTVKADSISDGAIAAPLVTPVGCVGVMAAEVRHAKETQGDALAAAAIVAAQLATLVGPPSARNGRSEAAGA
jgi:hypothetical protein